MDAAEKLRAWRLGLDYTLEDAGRLLGCNFTTISKIENRRQHPGLGLALKLERLLGISATVWGKSKLFRLPSSKRKTKSKPRHFESDAPGAL